MNPYEIENCKCTSVVYSFNDLKFNYQLSAYIFKKLRILCVDSHRYNPCTPLKGCIGVVEEEEDIAVCKHFFNFPGDGQRIGQQSIARFTSTSNIDQITIEYFNRNPDFPLPPRSMVVLTCDPSESAGRLEFVSDSDLSATLRFRTRYACASSYWTNSDGPPLDLIIGLIVAALITIVCFIVTLGIIVLCVNCAALKAEEVRMHRRRQMVLEQN